MMTSRFYLINDFDSFYRVLKKYKKMRSNVRKKYGNLTTF